MKVYEMDMLEKAKKELKFEGGIGMALKPIHGITRITKDFVNYFNEITGVAIMCYGVKIGSYNFDTKKLTHINGSNNIIIEKNTVKLINDFVGYEKYRVNTKKLDKFYNYMEQLDAGVSEYEAAEMFRCI